MGEARLFPVRTDGGTTTIFMSADELIEAAEQGRLMIAPDQSTAPAGVVGADRRDEATARRAEGGDDTSVPPIVDRVREIMGRVPPEAWASVPEDLIENLDHYLYGTPKR